MNEGPSPAPSRALVIAAFAAIYLIWGSTFLAIRIAVATIPPLLMAGSRHLVAGLLLYAWARSRGAPRPDRKAWTTTLILGAMFLAVGNGAVSWAEQRVASGLAAVVVAGGPVWTVLIEWLLGERPRPGLAVTSGLLLGVAGIVVLVAPWEGAHAAVDTVGALVLVVASITWATASVLSRRVRLPSPALLSTAMQMLAGGVVLLGAGLLGGEAGALRSRPIAAGSVAGLVYLIVFGSLVGFSCFTWLLRAVPAGRVATYAFVNPVVAVALGWAFAGERLGPRDAVAAAVILAGVVLVVLSPGASGPRHTRWRLPWRRPAYSDTDR